MNNHVHHCMLYKHIFFIEKYFLTLFIVLNTSTVCILNILEEKKSLRESTPLLFLRKYTSVVVVYNLIVHNESSR